MKAIQIVRPEELVYIDMPIPDVDEKNNVRVRMTAAGICGSDRGIYHGTNAAATYPRIIGHEMVGVVDRIGSGVKKLKVGDRVIVDQVTSCGMCYPCRIGRRNVCDHLQVRGVHIDGGYREYMTVPEKDCYVLPSFIPDEEAVMIEPTTIAVQACARAQLTADDTLLIFGAGALGSSLLKIAALTCRHIIVADLAAERLEEAKAAGAEHTIHTASELLRSAVDNYTDGRGVTVAIDAACTGDSLMQLLEVTGNAGRIVTMGFSTGQTPVNQYLITSKELDIRGSRLQNKRFGDAIRLLEEGKISLRGSVSHVFPFMEAREAFALADSQDPSVRKVVLKWD